MKIITGYTGTKNVTANADQGLHQGMFGTGNTVLNVRNKFAATLTDANTVTLQDGEGVMQGVHFRIDPGTSESVTIQSGTAGYKRIDLICARYTKDAVTGIEAVNLVVITGTPTTSTPTEPSYTQGDILSGNTQADFPLWKVTLDGLTPTLTAAFYVSSPGRPTEIGALFIQNNNVSRDADLFSDGSIVLEPGHLYLVSYTVQISMETMTVGGSIAHLELVNANDHSEFADFITLYHPIGGYLPLFHMIDVYGEPMTVKLRCDFSNGIPASGTTADIRAFIYQFT